MDRCGYERDNWWAVASASASTVSTVSTVSASRSRGGGELCKLRSAIDHDHGENDGRDGFLV